MDAKLSKRKTLLRRKTLVENLSRKPFTDNLHGKTFAAIEGLWVKGYWLYRYVFVGKMVFPPKAGFFHDEIECPVGATVLAIRLSGSLLTSRIIADSVKNSEEFLSQKWGFLGFCFITHWGHCASVRFFC